MNPVIKFTTLFGLLAVELAVEMTRNGQGSLTRILSAIFLLIAMVFVYRSFYGMRIQVEEGAAREAATAS
jgi:K(+)-stimulated pyrophosphate-energized sodium pump